MPAVVVFGIEDALASSLALPLEMLRAAQQHHRARSRRGAALRVVVASESGESVSMSGGLRMQVAAGADGLSEADLVIIPSLWRRPAQTVERHPCIAAGIVRLAASGARLCAVGTGSYFLACAGLLDNRPATTHWSYFKDFGTRFPAVKLQRRHLITRADRLYCAGSVNSVADLMIHFIRELFGSADALQVESQFSPEIRRPFETHSYIDGESGAHPDELVRMAQDWMLERLGEPLRVPQIAARAGLSERSLSRRFRAALGVTPLGFLQNSRLNLARDLLRQSNLAIGEIAHRCGYADPGHFSRAFATRTGSTPQEYRRRVRGKLFVATGQG